MKQTLRALIVFTGVVLVIGGCSGVVWGFGSGLTICTPPIQPVNLVNPAIITNCTKAGIQAALNVGGHIRFNCGSTPVTIAISSPLTLNPTVDTVLDGSGLVTLNGQNGTRILYKGWHDPVTTPSVTITIQNMRFINAKAPAGDEHSGGAIYVGHPGTRLHIINSTFQDNTTTEIDTPDNQGGAIFVHNSYETIITGSEFTNNSAGNGGAFGGIATGLYIVNSRFTGNDAVDTSTDGVVCGHGGAIHLDGVANSYNPTTNNRVYVCGSIFDQNTAVRGGGALKVTVSDNLGTKATYEKSSFTANYVSGVSGIEGHGGAIYHIEDDHAGGSNELNVEILASTFANNQTSHQGGGAWISVLGRAEVLNSTFANNRVNDSSLGMGGGLATGGDFTITNSTFAQNYAWYHGGGIQKGGTITLSNTLFYYNESERDWANYQINSSADVDGGGNLQFPRERFNQSGTPDDGLVTPTVIIADPLISPLASNGGPTETMAIQPGGAAANAGNQDRCLSVDQRGYPRNEGACDIGAYEAQSSGSYLLWTK